MNYSDSDRVRYILNAVGLSETKDYKKADLIVLNSCSVRKQAEDKIAGWGIKGRGLDAKIVLTGCMAVRKRGGFDKEVGKEKKKIKRKETGEEKYLKFLKERFPWINYILDIQDICDLPKILGLASLEDSFDSYLDIKPNSSIKYISNIPISTGCNFFCSYCIVPFSRGELFHRNYDEILNEVELNIKNGVKLICLVAQNVNSWTGDEKKNFSDLLNGVCALEGDFWVTFVSSNPMDFTDDMISSVSKNSKIMKWLNIALQSGSDDVLKRMNRGYTVSDFENLVSRIRKEIPDIRLTTDIIVGFPGESEDDFKGTLDLIKRLKFEMLYIGKYSPREGTVSSSFDDNVDFSLKKDRENELKRVLNNQRAIFHNDWVGKNISVLVLGGSRGLSYFYHEVIFNETLDKKYFGTFVDCRVLDFSLSGLIVDLVKTS